MSHMKNQIYVPVFATTLLVSAALLFSIQPLFSKMILPLLGGTPHVWNTAMLFFQVTLLAGYGYAHASARFLPLKVQACLQLGLLGVFTLVLPIAIPDGWLPPVDRDPTLWQLSVMAVAVGGPFFVLAGTAPLLQHWFSRSGDKDAGNPYFLYAASNLGSMASLLAYPFLIEPAAGLARQSAGWALGYALLILLTLGAAALVWNKGEKKKAAKKASAEAITWQQRGLWLILSFVPSSLMLGVTTFITTDIASVPLLWILPLALYVGTFIIVFARKEIFKREHIMLAQGVFIVLALGKLMVPYPMHPVPIIILHLVLFFTCALACHTELARSRPGASRLTEFYLIMSAGGALGGFFNAIVAPNVFVLPYEYAIALALAAMLRYGTDAGQSFKNTIEALKKRYEEKKLDILFTKESIFIGVILFASIFTAASLQEMVVFPAAILAAVIMVLLIQRRWLFALGALLILAFHPPGQPAEYFMLDKIVHQERNFFSILKVADTKSGERILLHGTTNHGGQPLDEKYRLTPLSYYSSSSPINDVFELLDYRKGKQKVAVIGLGIGVTACFDKEGRSFDFYEIDPDVVEIAENKNFFTYLSDCGSPYQTILGDGRLQIRNAPDYSYDMILLDAFSSDNIPIHLLTLEAIYTYLTKLKSNGILAFNVSNNYLDIEPVVAKAGETLKLPTYGRFATVSKIEGTDLIGYAAHFMIISPDKDNIPYFEDRGWSKARFRDGVKLWTDQFSNVVSVLGNKTGYKRFMDENAPKDEENNKVPD